MHLLWEAACKVGKVEEVYGPRAYYGLFGRLIGTILGTIGVPRLLWVGSLGTLEYRIVLQMAP